MSSRPRKGSASAARKGSESRGDGSSVKGNVEQDNVPVSAAAEQVNDGPSAVRAPEVSRQEAMLQALLQMVTEQRREFAEQRREFAEQRQIVMEQAERIRLLSDRLESREQAYARSVAEQVNVPGTGAAPVGNIAGAGEAPSRGTFSLQGPREVMSSGMNSEAVAGTPTPALQFGSPIVQQCGCVASCRGVSVHAEVLIAHMADAESSSCLGSDPQTSFEDGSAPSEIEGLRLIPLETVTPVISVQCGLLVARSTSDGFPQATYDRGPMMMTPTPDPPWSDMLTKSAPALDVRSLQLAAALQLTAVSGLGPAVEAATESNAVESVPVVRTYDIELDAPSVYHDDGALIGAVIQGCSAMTESNHEFVGRPLSISNTPIFTVDAKTGQFFQSNGLVLAAALTRSMTSAAVEKGGVEVGTQVHPFHPQTVAQIAVVVAIVSLQQFPWQKQSVEAQQRGFPESDIKEFDADSAVYVLSHTHRDWLLLYLSFVYWMVMTADIKLNPFAELQMDVLVFPHRINRDTGFIGIFVITDDFTGFVWLEGVKDQTVATLTAVLQNRVLRDFPKPGIIRSDGHPSLAAPQMAALLDSNGIKHRLSAPYNAKEHGGVESRIGNTFNLLRAHYNGDVVKAIYECERTLRNMPSEAHLQRQPYENVFGVRGEPTERLHDPEASGDLATQLESRRVAVEDLQRVMLRHRIHQQKLREAAVRPTQGFNVGDTVMLLRPPSDKMMSGGVAPYVVVTKEDSGVYYSVAILGPEGEPVGLPTRAAGAQLRPFDMSRTTPRAEWLRLQAEEFGSDTCPTKAVVGHRPSERMDASEGDLEFEVIWMTEEGDVTRFEPAQFLSAAGNVHFKEYVEAAGLKTRVRKQVQRERSKH